MDEIEDIFENEVYRTSSQRIENALVEMLESLSDGCQKYIDICSNSSPSTDYGNELDRQHLRLCLREIVTDKIVFIPSVFFVNYFRVALDKKQRKFTIAELRKSRSEKHKSCTID